MTVPENRDRALVVPVVDDVLQHVRVGALRYGEQRCSNGRPCDLDLLAQAPPGSKVTFRAVDVDETMRARREYRARLSRIAGSLALFDRVGDLGQ